jgi:hypothetical protein
MLRIRGYLGALVLPCLRRFWRADVPHMRAITDDYRADYHPWNDGEGRAYRVWLVERHYEYRDFNRLSREDQRNCWRWRHDHPGRY